MEFITILIEAWRFHNGFHPEQGTFEVWLCNVQQGFLVEGLKSHRLGESAYDEAGERLSAYRPLFVPFHVLFRLGEFKLVPDAAKQRTYCEDCTHFHGAGYGHDFLYCAMHPYGPEGGNCEDWEPAKWLLAEPRRPDHG